MHKSYDHTSLPDHLLRNVPREIFGNVLSAAKQIADNPLLHPKQRVKHYQIAFLNVDTLRHYTIWHLNNMPKFRLNAIINTDSILLNKQDKNPSGVTRFFNEEAKIPHEQTHALYEEEFDHIVENVLQEYPSLQQAMLLIDNIIRSYIFSVAIVLHNDGDNDHFDLNTESAYVSLADSINKSLTKEFLTSFLHFVPIGNGYTFDKDAYETGFRTLLKDRSMMRSLSDKNKPRICPFSRTIQDYFNTEIVRDSDSKFTLGGEKEGALLTFTANFIAEAERTYRAERQEIDAEIDKLNALYTAEAI